jgi:hypothetical protein
VLDRLTVDSFAPSLGEMFLLRPDGAHHSVELQLTRAETHDPEASSADESGNRSPFTLEFRGPAQPILQQQIYRIEHSRLGPLEIFIVPVGNDGSGTRYEAVFA